MNELSGYVNYIIDGVYERTIKDKNITITISTTYADIDDGYLTYTISDYHSGSLYSSGHFGINEPNTIDKLSKIYKKVCIDKFHVRSDGYFEGMFSSSTMRTSNSGNFSGNYTSLTKTSYFAGGSTATGSYYKPPHIDKDPVFSSAFK